MLKMTISKILLGLFLFLFYGGGYLQANEYRSCSLYKKTDGLASNTIDCIEQDAEGYFYFCTNKGLSVFDGSQFKNYHAQNTPGFPNIVNTLVELDARYLLIGSTDCGLFIFDKQKDFFRRLDGLDSLSGIQTVKVVMKSAGDGIWVGCSSGELWYIDDYRKLLEQDHTAQDWRLVPHPFKTVNALLEIDGTVFVAEQSCELYSVRPVNQSFLIERMVSFEEPQYIQSFLAVSEEELWIGTSCGIVRLMKSDSKWYVKATFAQSVGCVRCMALVDGRVFAGTEGKGLFEIYPETMQYKRMDEGSSQKYIITLKKDRVGNLWAGTWMGGAERFQLADPLFSQYMNGNPEKFASIVWSLFPVNDSLDRVYVGTQGGGLCMFRNDRQNITTWSDDYPSVSSIYADSVGTPIYVGTWGNGLKRFEPERGGYASLALPDFQHQRIFSISRFNRYELFVGTGASGLWLFNESTESARPLSFVDKSQGKSWVLNVRKVEKNRFGRGYWMATFNQGIFLFDLEEGEKVKILAHFPRIGKEPMQVASFFQDASGVWICTTNGLSFLECREEGYRLSRVSQLDGYYLADGCMEPHGLLLLASQDGLLVYHPERNDLRTYLSDYSIYRVLCSKGKVILGTSKGLISFLDKELLGNGSYGKPLIRSLSVNGTEIYPVESGKEGNPYIDEAVNYADTLILPAGNHNVKFMLSVLSPYCLSGSDALYYKMEGLDSYWSKAVPHDPYAEYRDLPAGSYTLHVRYNTPDNFGNERLLKVIKREFWWKTPLAFVVYALLLMASVVYWVVRSRLRYKKAFESRYEAIKRQKEEEVLQQKMRFFTNISHDLKTPLTLLITPLLELAKHPEMPEKFHPRLESMIANGNLLMKKMNKILNYRNSCLQDTSLSLETYPVRQLLYEIILPFKEYAERQGLTFEMSFPEEETGNRMMCTDRDKLESVLENLLSNAIKYTSEGGRVKVSSTLHDGNLLLEVADTGIGISEEDQPHVFDRYFRIASDGRGTGIGLYLVKQYVDLLKGSIEMESALSVGTMFRLCFPLEIQAASDEVEATDEGSQPIEWSDQENVLRILVVDDNKELREYLKQLFSPYYEVLEAADGSQALEVIQKTLPDLILSDLFMSGMDGLELCKNVKTHMKTSHIPFILLSAKDTVSTRMECWEAGADLFEQKPFNSQLLLANVANLLRNRNLLKYKYQIATPALSVAEQKEHEEKNLERQFLNEVNEGIERNLDKPELSVCELAEQLNMTQDQLYHKLKALSGMSPNQYIRTYRLNYAASLLRSGKFMVTEVLYRVGFNNPSYFTKCFKKQFGVLPSDYLNHAEECGDEGGEQNP